MTLFYLPLEPYIERYTAQWSAPKTGWLERNWIKAGIKYHRVEGVQPNVPRVIKSGCVLDAVGRSIFSFSQIAELLRSAEAGELTSKDVIYLDDFWTPGFESLPYAFSLMGLQPKIYSFLHAQSVDEFDFTFPMRLWMRHFEKGMGEVLSGIFVCCQCLKDLVVLGGIAPKEKVHVTGHPFNSEEVLERMPVLWRNTLKGFAATEQRSNQVIYCSRWDAEKDPRFFLEVAEKVIEKKPDARFVVCTSSAELRSNDPSLIFSLENTCRRYPSNIFLREGLSKEEYYSELVRSKIQFNCALQDFNPITLQEASVAGCYPVYPYFRSFPECFEHQMEFMYPHRDLQGAVDKVLQVLNRDDLWTVEQVKSREWIHNRFDSSWLRMLEAMGLAEGGNL